MKMMRTSVDDVVVAFVVSMLKLSTVLVAMPNVGLPVELSRSLMQDLVNSTLESFVP